MAIVDKITAEQIATLTGIIDFYNLRGVLPVARTWPRKPRPPYTPLQAEGMLVFSIACEDMSKISEHMLATWRASTEGKRQQWTDTFKGLAMQYWKITKTFAPIATDFEIIETATDYQVKWTILHDYLDPEKPETTEVLQTTLMSKESFKNTPKPIYFTLTDDNGIRCIAPYILLAA